MSITQISVSVEFGDITGIDYKIHTKYFNTICGQSVEFLSVKADGTYSYYCGLRS
jgi:hypothetical protein